MLEVKSIFVTDKNSFQCDEYFFHLNQKVPFVHIDQPTTQSIGHSVLEIATGYARSQTCFHDTPHDSSHIKNFSNKEYLIYCDQITGDHWVYHIESNKLLGHVKKPSISNQNKISHIYGNPLDVNFIFCHCEDDSFYVLYIGDFDVKNINNPTDGASLAKLTVSPFLKFPKSITSKSLKSAKERPVLVQFHPIFPLLFVGFNQGSILVSNNQRFVVVFCLV